MPEQLTEHVSDWRATVVVEREARSIRNVALAGTDSKNGYRYTTEALRSAAGLYENVPVFLDHPTSRARPRDRSARDLAGRVANVRFEDGRLRGDVHTLDTDAGRTLLGLAEGDGPGVGMSHVVLAERNADGSLVERIAEVISVDAVVFPASTQSFHESRSAAAARRDVVDQATPSRPLSPRAQPSARVDRVRRQMARCDSRKDACQAGSRCDASRCDDSHPTGHCRSAKRPASSSGTAVSAPASPPAAAGSLEGLLTAIETALPGHLRRLAAATGFRPGRGVRAGVFPGHVLVECRDEDSPPRSFAISWRLEGDRVVFGDEPIAAADLPAPPVSWSDLLARVPPFRPSFQESHDRLQRQIEHLLEHLRAASAERDRMTTALVERGPASVLRRPLTPPGIADDQFIRTIRRR